MNTAIVRQQPFLMRVEEICPVVYTGNTCRRAAEDFGPPRVQVGVEVYHTDGSVAAYDGAE